MGEFHFAFSRKVGAVIIMGYEPLGGAILTYRSYILLWSYFQDNIRGLQACARKIELVQYLRDLAKTAVGGGAVDSTGTVTLVDFVTLLI